MAANPFDTANPFAANQQPPAQSSPFPPDLPYLNTAPQPNRQTNTYTEISINDTPAQASAVPASTAPTATTTTSSYEPAPVSASGPFIEPQAQPATEKPQEKYHFWNLAYYRPLFDVDTSQVLARLLRTLVPVSNKFLQSVSTNPDMYGPFWVTATLVFMIAATGNFADYLDAYFNDRAEDWGYDLTKLSVGAAVIFGYNIVAPIVLWAVLKYLSIQLTLKESLCLYGYALFVFIPATIISVAPLDWLRWVAMMGAAAVSTFFLVFNLFGIVVSGHAKTGLPVILVIGALHVGLALSFKLYFFSF